MLYSSSWSWQWLAVGSSCQSSPWPINAAALALSYFFIRNKRHGICSEGFLRGLCCPSSWVKQPAADRNGRYHNHWLHRLRFINNGKIHIPHLLIISGCFHLLSQLLVASTSSYNQKWGCNQFSLSVVASNLIIPGCIYLFL